MSTQGSSSAQLSIEPLDGDGAIFRFQGELDACAATHLEPELSEALAPEPSRILVDLRPLTYIDSSGIRLLMRIIGRAPAGRRVAVVNAESVAARRVLEIVGLGRVVPIEDTPEAALRHLDGA